MKQSNKTASMVIIVLVIIAIIVLIYYIKNNNGNEITEEEIKCIASKSVLFVSKTCGVCAQQKEIFKDYIDYFNIIECTSNIELCKENKVVRVPTWNINGENYIGLKTLKELKELTGC